MQDWMKVELIELEKTEIGKPVKKIDVWSDGIILFA
jgi:hypothetical protein